jgi:hypothetical protein
MIIANIMIGSQTNAMSPNARSASSGSNGITGAYRQ